MLSTIYYNSLSTFIIVNSSTVYSVFTTVEQFDVNSNKLCLTKFLHSLNMYKCTYHLLKIEAYIPPKRW